MNDPYGPLNSLITAAVWVLICCSGLIAATTVEWVRARRARRTR